MNLVRSILDVANHKGMKSSKTKSSVPINHVLYEMSIFGEECDKTIRQMSSYYHECIKMMG